MLRHLKEQKHMCIRGAYEKVATGLGLAQGAKRNIRVCCFRRSRVQIWELAPNSYGAMADKAQTARHTLCSNRSLNCSYITGTKCRLSQYRFSFCVSAALAMLRTSSTCQCSA